MFVLIDHSTRNTYLCEDEEHVIRMCNYIMASEGDDARVSNMFEAVGCDFTTHEIVPIPENWR